MAEEHGSVRKNLILRLAQNEPVVKVIQDADYHLSQQGKSRIHALRKSTGSQRQPKGKDRVLISYSLEGKSQKPPVVGGYLDVKVTELFQCNHPERQFHKGTIQMSEIEDGS